MKADDPTRSRRHRRCGLLWGILVGGLSLSACRCTSRPEAFVAIRPRAAGLAPGASQQFSASIAGSDGGAWSWSVLEGTSGGRVRPDGLYTAPGAAGTYHVVAASRARAGAWGAAAIRVGRSGCGREVATGLQARSIDANRKRRTYLLWVPGSYRPDVPLPVVFSFHGAGGDGANSRAMTGLEAPSHGRAIFVYPDGLGGAWDLRDGGDDVLLFDAIVQSLWETHCIDGSRIFAAGFSFGATLSNLLGCYRGDLVRAVAAVAGGVIPRSPTCRGDGDRPARPQPVAAWIAYGAKDGFYRTYAERNRQFWLHRNGCGESASPTAPTPCETHAGCEPGFPVVWCRHGGSHEWPPFASEAIWKFFASLP